MSFLSEEAEERIRYLTEATNNWLASLTITELEEACAKGECVLTFEGFPATAAGVTSILSNLIPRMCGEDTELKFDYGIAGSIWFDAEVPGVDGSNDERPVRVALIPPNFHPAGVQHMFHVYCLLQIYA